MLIIFDFSDNNSKNFYYKGELEGKDCSLKIDTGSDVSLVNEKFIQKNKERLPIKERNLKYLTGERVPFKSKVLVNVRIRKYSLEIPIFIVKIQDDVWC